MPQVIHEHSNDFALASSLLRARFYVRAYASSLVISSFSSALSVPSVVHCFGMFRTQSIRIFAASANFWSLLIPFP